MKVKSPPASSVINLLLILLLFLSSAGMCGRLYAQNSSPANTIETLWPLIEARLQQPGGDTSRYFILEEVRSHCGKDYDCLYKAYYNVIFNLERRFNLPLAIYVCEEMVNVTREYKDLKQEGGVYMNLSRYYDAQGTDRLASVYIDKALAIFEQVGIYMPIVEAKMTKLERSTKYRELEEVLSDMDALLADAIEKRDSLAIYHLHGRMIPLKFTAQRYEEVAGHIAALEKMPVSYPIRPAVMSKLITAARAHAKLAQIKNNIDEAALYYEKALRLCEENGDPWLEVNILDALTELEWDRGNRSLAKSYLDRAHEKAEKHQIDDLLVSIFEWEAYIAEKEGRYADALEYTKKQYSQKEKLESRSAGFDLKNYYLEQEKEQLRVENENKELELNLKGTQLRFSIITLTLVFLLVAGLVIGLYQQWKSRKKLTAKNALIRQQSAQLKTLDMAKSRFFANVSHELRTPLTLILGPVRTLLKENHLTEKQTKLLQMASQSGKQLEQLVNEILDLRKLEMGKMELQLQPVELHAFFNSYFAQFESLAAYKQIDFSFETCIDSKVVAAIDREKYRQILYNLLSNAFKFTSNGGAIKAIVAINGGTLELKVADSGSGIHPDDLPHVFDRFFQTKRPDTPAQGGTGIGLNLCAEYARLFGGDIHVESTLGKGSVFQVAIPIKIVDSLPALNSSYQLHDQDIETNTEPVGLQEPSDEPKPTVLVVEDNPDLQAYIRLVLEEKYDVVTAENGQAALDYLLPTNNEQPIPKLILSDLMMPVMDGYQLLEKLKSNDVTRHIPVIMLTARAEARDKLKALRIGVDDYLTKPFEEEELLARMDNLLKNQMNRREEALAGNEPAAAAFSFSETDRTWLETFENYIFDNLSSDILYIPRLAQEFAMSESTLLRQLKRLTGLSPSQYLLEVRLDRACQLLENRTHDSIAKVASEVGYNDVRSFSRVFKQRFGKLPSDF